MDLPHPSPDPDLENRDHDAIYHMIIKIAVESVWNEACNTKHVI